MSCGVVAGDSGWGSSVFFPEITARTATVRTAPARTLNTTRRLPAIGLREMV
jgi:hypothetical protein